MLSIIVLFVLTMQQSATQTPLCWEVCKQTCIKITGNATVDQCLVNCPCKCSLPCKNVCIAYQLGVQCLNKCGCPPEMEKYFTPEPAKTYNFAPNAPQAAPTAQVGMPAATYPMMDMDLEDVWMMQQMKSQLPPQANPAAPNVVPQAAPAAPAIAPATPVTPMGFDVYMQQKMQMKIMKCQMECNWKCSAYSMNNPQLMQQCLTVCTC